MLYTKPLVGKELKGRPTDRLGYIESLWRFPERGQSIQKLLDACPYLSLNQKSQLLQLCSRYANEEYEYRRVHKDWYHAHGILAVQLILATFANAKSVPLSHEDCLNFLTGVLLHDYKGIVSGSSQATAKDELILRDFADISCVDWHAVLRIIHSTDYQHGNIAWGLNLFSGDQSEVTINNPGLEETLICYGDLVGQISSLSYWNQRREMLSSLGFKEAFIPLKIVYLADMLLNSVYENWGEVIPDGVIESFLKNTESSREFYQLPLPRCGSV